MKIFYNPKLKQAARDLRKQGVLSEVLLWTHLKGRKVSGYQFMRQKPIGDYIVDFYCSPLHLVIEIDGESHVGKPGYDSNRQEYLKSIGLRVIRFNDVDVKKDINAVMIAIGSEIENIGKTTPPSHLIMEKQPPLSPFIKGVRQPPLSPFVKGESTPLPVALTLDEKEHF
jgi:very-short-patch-repair endonuclease